MRLNSAFTALTTRYFCACARVEVQITLHTPPAFTGCFPAECCQVSLAVRKKGAFTPLTRPSTLPFFACKPSFATEYSQTLPATARIRSEFGGSYARKPGIQAHSFALEVPGEQLFCTAATAFSASLSPKCPLEGLSAAQQHPAVSYHPTIVPAHHRCPP